MNCNLGSGCCKKRLKFDLNDIKNLVGIGKVISTALIGEFIFN